MNKIEFMKGIEELSLFFPRFKPNNKQLSAWFIKLGDYSDAAMRLAVEEITEGSVLPSFHILMTTLLKCERATTRQPPRIPESQGFAPESKEKWELVSYGMSELLRFMSSNLEGLERRAGLDELKDFWLQVYPKLPGYKNQEQVQKMIDYKDWQKLVDLGFLETLPQAREVAIPKYSSEANFLPNIVWEE